MAYFDLFNYPLTIEDICLFLDSEAGQEDVEHRIEVLVREGRLFRTGPFYSLQDNASLAARRLRGEAHADELMRIANRGGRLLYRFPYVRGVFISGSLSKRCADEKADIDYFIITKAKRIWIARTLLHLFKKLSYIRGHQHHYCMNYFIDEDALEIREKNIFTAVEILTLMPVCGNGDIRKFFETNDWVGRFLPRYGERTGNAAAAHRSFALKGMIEWLFDGRLGSRLESWLRGLTDRRWKEKTQRGDVNGKGDPMSLQCGEHFSRPDPDIFQQRILNKYHRRVKEVMEHGMVTADWRMGE